MVRGARLGDTPGGGSCAAGCAGGALSGAAAGEAALRLAAGASAHRPGETSAPRTLQMPLSIATLRGIIRAHTPAHQQLLKSTCLLEMADFQIFSSIGPLKTYCEPELFGP